MVEFVIQSGYRPGVIGRIVELHGTYYARDWGFGAHFEALEARELGAFVDDYQPERDGLWTANLDGRVEGSIAIDGSRVDSVGAYLRWFIVSDALRGRGAGAKLLRTAVDFCDEHSYERIVLDTFAGLVAARHLYEREGFVLVGEQLGAQYGSEILEQRLERRFHPVL